MKHCLLWLVVLMAAGTAAPAAAQYVFLDVDGDGFNSVGGGGGHDALNVTKDHVDVYFVTDKYRDNSDAACLQSLDPLSMSSYEFTLHASGPGSVVYGTWTDNLGFSTVLTPCSPYCSAGTDIWIAMGSSNFLPPGKYKVGSLAIGVTVSCSVLEIVPGSASLDPLSGTTFSSECPGNLANGRIRLADDFADANGTDGCGAVSPTTWGKIKSLYR